MIRIRITIVSEGPTVLSCFFLTINYPFSIAKESLLKEQLKYHVVYLLRLTSNTLISIDLFAFLRNSRMAASLCQSVSRL